MTWINDTTILPDAITLGATGDAELVQELADIQRQEMKALGGKPTDRERGLVLGDFPSCTRNPQTKQPYQKK